MQLAMWRHPRRCFVRCGSLAALQSAVEQLRGRSEAKLIFIFIFFAVWFSPFRLSSFISRTWICLSNSSRFFLLFLVPLSLFLPSYRTSETISGLHFPSQNNQNYERAALSGRRCLASPREVAGSRREGGFVVCKYACSLRWPVGVQRVSTGCPESAHLGDRVNGASRKDVLVFLPGVLLVFLLS